MENLGTGGPQREEELVSEPNIIGQIKYARLRWLGYVERMGDDQAANTYLGQPTNGNPRYGVIKDLDKAEYEKMFGLGTRPGQMAYFADY